LDVCVLLSIVELSFFLSHEGLRPVEESVGHKNTPKKKKNGRLSHHQDGI
jgi:hypothetical protein